MTVPMAEKPSGAAIQDLVSKKRHPFPLGHSKRNFALRQAALLFSDQFDGCWI
jgi:hypothetical protein